MEAILARSVRQLTRVRMLSSSSHKKADFGFKDVDAGDKEKLVRSVFSSVASKYDVMNDLMSFGIHRIWKDEFVSMIGLGASAKIDPNYLPRHLDVAGGTGDIAFRSISTLAKVYRPIIQDKISANEFVDVKNRPVVVCDINPEMLAVGKSRAVSQVGAENAKLMDFVEGNAEHLPFEDESFDLYTIAFGLRNVTNKDIAIKEAHRVLKKGGRMMILEFSHLQNPLMKQVYDKFSFEVIPKIGKVVTNDEESYQYLVESIRRFPKQDDLLNMMRHEGFSCCSYVNFTFGVVAVHTGFKL